MGLMEKAMQYKRELNRKGEETLIDRIKGPADAEMPGDEIEGMDEVRETRNAPRGGAQGGKSGVPPGEQAGNGDADTDMLVLDKNDLVEVVEPFASDDLTAEEASSAPGIDDEWIEKELEDITSRNRDEKDELTGIDAKRRGPSEGFDGEQEGRQAGHGKERTIPDAPDYEGSFRDFMVLYEAGKEIVQAMTQEELFDTLIFLIMGQIAVSSVSIITRNSEEEDRWTITASMGLSIDENLSFDGNGGLMRDFSEKKEIIDIEDYSRNEACKQDYLTFISIDARLMVPLVYDDDLIGIVVLGNKISTDDFTAEEKDFLYSVSRFAVITYHTILISGINEREVRSLNKKISHNARITSLQNTLYSRDSLDEAKRVIREEMSRLGVETYCFFKLNEFNNRYVPVIAEEQDFISIMESNTTIETKNGLIQYMLKAKGPVTVDDIGTLDALGDAFTRAQIRRMDHFRLYPFHLGISLVGFLIVFKKPESGNFDEINDILKTVTDLVFPYIISTDNIRYTKRKYIDTVEHVLNRINEELDRVKKLGIPLSLVELSIKNFKRYYSVHGMEMAHGLMTGIEELIKSKLSDVDFSFRHDRNRVLIILPGKSKDFAVPMANALKNEIVNSFSSRDLQLLVTSLCSEYPKDGDDLFSLVDSIS